MLEVLSPLTSRVALGNHEIIRASHRAMGYSTVSRRILCVAGNASGAAESSSPPNVRSSKSIGPSVPLQSSSPSLADRIDQFDHSAYGLARKPWEDLPEFCQQRRPFLELGREVCSPLLVAAQNAAGTQSPGKKTFLPSTGSPQARVRFCKC